MTNDLISRSDLWTDIMMLPHNGDIISSEEVEEAIVEAPAVDAVPVVRCKDCKHFYDTHINPAHSCKRGGTQVWDVSFTPDDFCSYGERRDDDD